jgi:hydrogenase expression/formation protein HypD
MKYADEFRDSRLSGKLLEEIKKETARLSKNINIMEVCGTHTMAISRFGIRNLLPEEINLLSGPGCPVCVSTDKYIDKAIKLSKMQGITVATFGDMMRVPGSFSSLEKEKAAGASVEIVYSAYDALKLAEKNPETEIVFLAVGFETTIPSVALTIRDAKNKNLKNFSVLAGHKLIPPAMKSLLEDREVNIGGFLCPGHVSTIIGNEPYGFIPEKYGIPCVISGFEPVDILQSVLMLLKQINNKNISVQIQYKRAVKAEGNVKAREVMYQIFENSDAEWRGLGIIQKSGLKVKKTYGQYDAENKFDIEIEKASVEKGCICGEILKGTKTPVQCLLFGKKCTPENPVGPCRVSSEGTCAAYYKYNK